MTMTGQPSHQDSTCKENADWEEVELWLDEDVLAAFRATGDGWQTRINAALKDWLRTHSLA